MYHVPIAAIAVVGFLVVLGNAAKVTDESIMYLPIVPGETGPHVGPPAAMETADRHHDTRSSDGAAFTPEERAFYDVVCQQQFAELAECTRHFPTALFAWNATVRVPGAASVFAALQAKLRAKQCLKVVVLGSSITAGSCGYSNRHPDCRSALAVNRSLNYNNLPSDAILSTATSTGRTAGRS